MTLIYLTLDQAIDIHAKTVEVSGGGALGHLEIGKLDSVLQHIQNDDYYPTLEEKLTHLFFCSNKFHSFEDGNKRIAISLCVFMLNVNGYLYCLDTFCREMENVSYHVAAGSITKELLLEIMTAVIDVDTDSEELKMKILASICPIEDDHVEPQ
ncbi:type II toxin-antitoxin system death-on-curing family toxin [Crateriforma conspicua]|uniref:Fic/DOC family protein n=1 Tax=Crateriforma conspicua TaxID=2527996 RepID=A0A5C5Y8I9_9PLAN|nr:Fic family protein [Crateriforma conspicua]TWT71650.1 Fic/DOC family protein [Crateriforma conspicua]